MSFAKATPRRQQGTSEFLQACERNMPKGKRIVAVRVDSAAYQAAIFNWCEVTGTVFAIGADQDAAVKAAIAGIPESDWKTFRDGEIAETIHCMNKTDKAFRLIVLRRPREQDLFEDNGPYRYHAIASNRADEDAATTMQWYCKRGEASENRIKDLKIGLDVLLPLRRASSLPMFVYLPGDGRHEATCAEGDHFVSLRPVLHRLQLAKFLLQPPPCRLCAV